MENNSEDENSDNGLQIVIESPKPKKRAKKELDETDKKIIETVEKDLEENLEEKAAKANLTAKHVKNIIKEVVTNEHVLALVRHAENPDNHDELITVYEPKYTRAKTKQLLSTNIQQKILPWMPPPKPVSEVQRLFTEDLQEDSSGDEYVPESPSKNSSFNSSQLDTSHCTIKDDEDANIALRTRSKLCLSHTPLEVIEEAFMPPDITTDMYDMDCDDEVWTEFLKTFTRPLDEVTKAAEDEDHDPEYNILADEEIDEVDREELRADRAVTVSRKELNCLMAELFEFADIYESNKLTDKNAASNNLPSDEKSEEVEDNAALSDSENDPNIAIKKCQIPILTQQLRQHVQMLAQNFLLSYEHPEFSELAFKFKEMLNDIVVGNKAKDDSVYDVVNLQPAINLIDDWVKLFNTGNEEVRECKRYVEKVISESIQAKLSGREYIVRFPPLLMKTVCSSDVFIYPNLLPRIPFKSLHVRGVSKFFTHGEENLIALFLEQAIPYLRQDPFYLTHHKKINMERVCQLLGNLLFTNVRPSHIARYIRSRKHPNSYENPIKSFYRTKKAPPSVHYVTRMDDKNVLPPCKQRPELLPYVWRKYIYPEEKNEKSFVSESQLYTSINNQVVFLPYPLQLQPPVQVNVVPPYNINFSKRTTGNRRLLPKGPVSPIVTSKRRRKHICGKRTKVSKSCKENSNITQKGKVNKLQNTMLPDMPSLGNTPLKNDNSQTDASAKDNTTVGNKKEESLSFKNIASYFHSYNPTGVNQVRRNFEGISEFCNNTNQDSTQKELFFSSVANSTEKDNPDDINELMKASSTVKNVTKKKPSGAEKKRAKVRREFAFNLVMATPDQLDVRNQKEENFADAFFDKLRQTLTVKDYDKLVGILGHYDQTRGDFLQLFKSVQTVLFPKYVELAEEFYLFLTDIQAHKVGQLMPYFLMKDMDRFIKKLHIYFKDQPSQMKKIIKCITELSENPDITMENIKTSVIPLFKGNAALTDWFLQIFPCERPPKMLTSLPHETIDISKELARQPGEDICETVIFPDTDDPYGGANCICQCHNVENVQFKSRSHHCKQCGLKFIQGKVYIQTGKGLRPAVVSFLTNSEKDHSKRLAAAERKRSEVSPNKQVTSPYKDTHAHDENSNESEDDENKKKKQPKTQRKRKIKDRDKPNTKGPKKSIKSEKIKSESAKGAKNSTKRQSKKRPTVKKIPENKPCSSLGQQKRPAETQEVQYSEPPEQVELKVSSDHSGESGSEFFESSQDITNTDSEDSDLANVQSREQHASWTREEDKIILQAFRQSSDNEETFKQISKVLQNRSVVEIKNRFHKLMSLLQEMAAT